ncbi:MAG TPA: hypothetical protein PLJ31_15875, partial [Armatimonadota bacterium]|nr:hypothetical protein [Armatimonadota bacterium]
TRWEEGLGLLEQAVAVTPERKREDAERMLLLGRFIRNCVQTAINTKRWWQLKQAALEEKDPQKAGALLDDLVRLGEAELANVRDTIPLVEADSRLGWEPSMEYMTDRAHLEWKIAQLTRVLEEEIPEYRSKLGSAA